jgi:hypothetical protein
MLTEIEKEANDLLQGASYAVDHNDALLKLKSLPEVSYALEKILDMHGQCPHKVIACAFMLGAYMGIQYNDMKVFTEEK